MANKLNLEGFTVSTSDVCTADGGFVGDVTGDVTGDLTGGIALSTLTTYPAAGAIALTDDIAVLNGGSATAAMTLAAPGAANIGKLLVITCSDSTNVCDVDVATSVGAQTITFTVGEGALLCATSTFVWEVVSTTASVA